MSYTEIVAFKNGKACDVKEIQNAWRGAMSVWMLMDESHLPPYYASWDPAKKVSRASAMMDPNAMKQVWELANNENVPIDERLVMGTTFDKALVKRENLTRLIEAFKNFDKTYPDKSSMLEQSEILESFLEDEEIDVVGWNQTSVSENPWFTWNEDKEEYVPYDINTMEEHWFLMDDFKEE